MGECFRLPHYTVERSKHDSKKDESKAGLMRA